jgi:hypothetical protein
MRVWQVTKIAQQTQLTAGERLLWAAKSFALGGIAGAIGTSLSPSWVCGVALDSRV